MSTFFRRAVVGTAVALCCLPPRALQAAPARVTSLLPEGDVRGTVTDSASGQPLVSAEVAVSQNGQGITNAETDHFGRFVVHALPPGTYQVSVHYIGFRPLTRTVVVGATGDAPRLDFRMVAAPVSLAAVEVRAESPVALNVRTGDQMFKQNEYHGSPTNTTSQILQQSMAGAVRAPTGEVHIRGQHAEYTYYIDGVPVPAGISGSLNELFDPQVVNTIDFQTGGWDAEYGNKNTAIVNVHTKIPTGAFHGDVSGYVGSFNGRGTAASASTNSGPLGLFGALAYQTTDMRREPLSFDTVTFTPRNFHNHGEDLFGFGKVNYTIDPKNLLNLNMNWSRTTFQVPYDSTGNAFSDDQQRDVNGFANLSWRRMFGGNDVVTEEAAPSELFVGAFVRGGSLDFTPSTRDIPAFVFYPDTTKKYNLSESRHFTTYGAKIDYLLRPAREWEFKTGILASTTSGHETFASFDARGRPGPGSDAGLNGHDIGLYAQTVWLPVEKFELRTGVRYDAHNAPFAGTRTQWSPRLRLNFFPDPSTTLYAYYGRLFVPTNIEELREITNSGTGQVASPTVPERDHFYEAGVVHRFPVAGLVTKLSGYHKISTPGIDDATIPGSAIVTSVNIQRISVTGVEGVIEVRPAGPLSGYLNAALIHAYGSGMLSGGFLPIEPPKGNFDLDHDQRLSLVGSATYSERGAFISATAIYGSGLTNGLVPSDRPRAPYGTDLFAFNRDFKVKPNTIFNLSAGYAIVSGATVVRPQIYIDNVFNSHYLLKGSLFSGAAVGHPRSVQFRLNVGV